jgi:ATP-dependent RNA helicase DeaD
LFFENSCRWLVLGDFSLHMAAKPVVSRLWWGNEVFMDFIDMQIPASLRSEIVAHGYTTATPVQEKIVSPEYATGDLLVSSKTGSGKTIGFGLAIAPQLLGGANKLPPTKTPRALVVAPTRELAQQVAEELFWLYRGADGRMATCVGGMDIRREQKLLYGGPHIVVGTPGRLCDHIKRGSLKLEGVEAVILDEADEMLDMGFREELEFILEAAKDRTRTLLFSATIPTEIERMAQRYTKNAKRIATEEVGEAHGDIEYIAHRVASKEKEAAVVNVLRFYDAKSALVFVATRDGVNDLAERLMERGFSTVALSGELSQANRDRAIQMMKSGHSRVLVATDVAARGLDLPDISLVIHADPPNDHSVLQHRSGRTGRAGQKGIAVILVPMAREGYVERQLREANITAQLVPVPMAQEIEPLDAERFVSDVTSLFAETTPQQKKIAETLLEKYSAQDLVAAFVRREQRALPVIEEMPMTRRLLSGKSPSSDRALTPRRESLDRGTSSSYDASGEYVWFKVNVGRSQQADPKWLIPLLCRRGNVRGGDIGQIDISTRHTEFQIKKRLADEFERSSQMPDTKDPKIHFNRIGGEAPVVVAPARVIKPASEVKPAPVLVAPVKAEVKPEPKLAPIKVEKSTAELSSPKQENTVEIKLPKIKAIKAKADVVAPEIVAKPVVAPVKDEVKVSKPAAKVETKPEVKPAPVKVEAAPVKTEVKVSKVEKAEVKPIKPAPVKVEQKSESKPKPAATFIEAKLDSKAEVTRPAKPKKADHKKQRAKDDDDTPESAIDLTPKRAIKTNPWIEKFKQEADRKKKLSLEAPKKTKKK